jgi:putative transcriptional regulator
MSDSKILKGMRQAVAHAKGQKVTARHTIVQVPPDIDVKVIRTSLGMTQIEFAAKFGFSPGSIQNWEQGHRHPDGAARVLLTVIAANPDAVIQALPR